MKRWLTVMVLTVVVITGVLLGGLALKVKVGGQLGKAKSQCRYRIGQNEVLIVQILKDNRITTSDLYDRHGRLQGQDVIMRYREAVFTDPDADCAVKQNELLEAALLAVRDHRPSRTNLFTIWWQAPSFIKVTKDLEAAYQASYQR